MGWTVYNTQVQIDANSNSYTLPVDLLEVRSVPYSGVGRTAVELFDGRMIQRIDGWRHVVELSWKELTATQASDLFNAVSDLYGGVGGTIIPDTEAPTNTIDVVIQNAADSISAIFDGRVRKRPASLTLVSQDIEVSPFSWIPS